ncbi:hypothetical protein BEH94_04510 [Candidatus Altiarchaeales archaeon WOR_SM1_SCG]|nr:hypothetical protein BEH94_04510 [Candidatus Altiarchaeales archaeon WOR_SM1_SCG]
MNAKSAVFAAVSIAPQSIRSLKNKLQYAPSTIYEASENLVQEGLAVTRRELGKVIVDVASTYRARKLREIYLKSLIHGVDPCELMKKNTLLVRSKLEEKNIKNIMKATALSYHTVNAVLKALAEWNMINVISRRPLTVEINQTHPVNKLLDEYIGQKTESKGTDVFYKGTIPFTRIISTPSEVERILYEKIREGISIKNTGFLMRGKEDLNIVESVEKKINIEDFFLNGITTTEGAEDFCIQVIASKKLNYDKLLDKSKKKSMANVVGCYLNIIRDINPEIVDNKIIEKFFNIASKKRKTFLKKEEKYGKEGWEDNYEKKWNVDLYLDIGAIKHGIRVI